MKAVEDMVFVGLNSHVVALDADTTGAICGQLAGAFWGESNIPEPLRSGLARMDMLENALAGILGA
jgi:ADP-ribosylglycohydrolase